MSQDHLVEHLTHLLKDQGLRIVELPSDTSTSELAAAALETAVDSIAKSLLFFVDEAPVLILAAGDRRVSPSRLAAELHARKVRLARPPEVQQLTGYPVGGVPPVGHKEKLAVLMDRSLFRHATIYAAGGASNAIFAVAPEVLLAMTGAKVVEVCA